MRGEDKKMRAKNVVEKPEEKILDAALDVVVENTICGTRMHLIADRAGMVQSNLHYYYRTKNDLMLALQKKVLKRCLDLRERLKVEADNTLEDQLEVFIKQKLEFILNEKKYDFAEIDFWVQGHTNPDIQENFDSSFEGWRKEIRKMLDNYAPELSDQKKDFLPYFIVSILEGASMQYLINEDRFDVEEYFKYSKEVILKTILE
ncbi:MAG: TetR family transcriptional regulator [Anaerocolumna sp.]|jgi:AcrR family transcriptional regulator|nr:TetR family transcriptional regulator [Anaerocolumna sp.]